MDDGRPRVGGVKRPGAVGASWCRRASNVAREVTWEEKHPVNYHLCVRRVSCRISCLERHLVPYLRRLCWALGTVPGMEPHFRP